MIEEIIQKPKRKYVRKPKVVVPEVVVPKVVVPEVVVSLSPNGSLRDRGPEVVVPDEVVQEPVPEPEIVSESTKKPRSQKQLDAFNRMREARLKKSAELQELKAFEKEKQLFEKEQLKVEKMEKKIVRKVSRVPKSSPRPAPPVPVPAPVPQGGPALGGPIHRPQVSSHQLVPFKETNVRPILFV